jgi:hypothetical protein|tara:strand:- start:409 stop:705 length:297 start_codon:yes stop_codon:yes gene_type:complete
VVKLHFKNPEEFESLFKSRDIRITNSVVKGIKEAMQKNARSAKLFELSFEGAELAYEIALPQKEWLGALKTSLDHYHKNNLVNEQIDTWELLEVVKTW